ncbi:MAG: UDPGP type 1 family protein [Planctomycetota bacterium]|nr:UDPGP type 1 family protein [Planctomycetota bacterium]
MSDVPKELHQRIAEYGQEHVLTYWNELGQQQQRMFLQQLQSIDFNQFGMLQKQFSQCLEDPKQKNLQSSPFVTIGGAEEYESLKSIGEDIIRGGKLAVLTVAGGQGTRLGWSGPKGTFPATPVTGKSLFQLIAEQIVFASQKYAISIPWYIMTSVENDTITRSFLLDNNCFGLDRTDIFIFMQGEVPVIDADGKMLLASMNQISMNPDGHGGVIAALKQSGGLEEMESRGIEYLSYVQVDNPLAKVVDPAFLALHIDKKRSSGEITSKCVEKTSPDERVGVFCEVDGKTTIVEYSDMSQEDKTAVDDEENLTFRAGSIAIHMLSTEFLQRVAQDLPWHVAKKTVPYLSVENGKLIDPKEANAFKFERFIFDILSFSIQPLIVETSREEEFAPIKNSDGDDSPETSHYMQIQRAVNWLKARGKRVPDSAVVEIGPLAGASSEDLDLKKFPETVEEEEIISL